MRLELRDETGARVADLDRDAAPLAAYSPYDGCVRPSPTRISPCYMLESLYLLLLI